ncbi:MAG: ribonuclease inhibitor [Methanosphaera sp. rholeuAM6]|nr:MAG: ribonuclease inhibitor [Methanosphaera sp. rholeuAM6]
MKHITLNGKKIKKESHEYLIRKLDLPDYYGRNLDALYDCLTDIGVETEIKLINSEEVSLDLIDTFFDASLENEYLFFVCDE